MNIGCISGCGKIAKFRGLCFSCRDLLRKVGLTDEQAVEMGLILPNAEKGNRAKLGRVTYRSFQCR
jgi:hypothetical protein